MTTEVDLTITNLSRAHKKAQKDMASLIEAMTALESQLVHLPDNWLLLNMDSEKGKVLSLVVFPQGVRAINHKKLQKWIGHQLTRSALTQTCYHCESAFQSRSSNSSRLYMWCTVCGFSCFNWKQ